MVLLIWLLFRWETAAGEEGNTEHRGPAVGGQTRPLCWMKSCVIITEAASAWHWLTLRAALLLLWIFIVFNHLLGWKGHHSSKCRCTEAPEVGLCLLFARAFNLYCNFFLKICMRVVIDNHGDASACHVFFFLPVLSFALIIDTVSENVLPTTRSACFMTTGTCMCFHLCLTSAPGYQC